ncbi:hypothetical protein ACWEKT_37525 [Nocardia takedensis]
MQQNPSSPAPFDNEPTSLRPQHTAASSPPQRPGSPTPSEATDTSSMAHHVAREGIGGLAKGLGVRLAHWIWDRCASLIEQDS